jgi:hypothetical protein
MSQSLADALNHAKADSDTVQQGLRLFLAEQTDDLTPKEMLAELKAAGGAEGVDALLKKLTTDSEALNQAALAAMQGAWRDAAARPAVESALAHAKDKLPVIELGILAVVAMYGMYRAIPAQPTKVTTKITVGADGSYTEEKVEEHEAFTPVLSAFSKLFGKTKGVDAKGD